MTASRLKTTILILAASMILILLAFFYFIVYRGYADHFFLKAVNRKLPFTLSWQERAWLTVKKLEIKMENNYFQAPELKVSLKPEFWGKIGAAGILEFENGYASQGEHHLIRDIAAKIPFEYRWPGHSYLLGVGDLRARGWGGSICLKGKMDFKKKYKKKYFTIEGVFDKINMALLSTDINIKKFGGRGLWEGKINLNYGQRQGLEGGGEFNLLPPGGDIKTILLKDLVQNIPEGEARKKLLEGLGGGEYFSLSRGDMSFDIKDENIKIKLLLKGEKGLLDFDINLPTSLVEKFLKRIGGARL